jgi:hypothetical protein
VDQRDELLKRLAGVQKSLCGVYESGAGMSAASCGREREQFIDLFLSRLLPPGYRFGSGDVIDTRGSRSGQLDVVVEFTFLPSLPAVGGSTRLYLAEGVAAVVEVKSDLAKQWNEVQATASALRTLERQFHVPGFTPYGPPPKQIPLFAVGYTGWRQLDTVREKAGAGVVDGLLVIDSGLFSTRSDFPNGLWAQGPLALWGLISALHYCTLSVVINAFSPIEYVRQYGSTTAEPGAAPDPARVKEPS